MSPPCRRPDLAVDARRATVAATGRYAFAALGPIAVAAANFALSFSMLRLGRPEAFGTFTVLFAAAMFTVALSAALFGAPMQVRGRAGDAGGPAATESVAAAALAAALVAVPGFALLGARLGLGWALAGCYGLFAALTVLRSVGRAWCYAVARPRRVALSDACYAGGTLAAFALAVGPGRLAPSHAVYPALALGTAAATLPLGRGFVRLLARPRSAALLGYRAIWSEQSRWSLIGVTTTEAVANAHTYLLTALAGAATLAPIAAGALLVRPINVVQNALVEFERPQLARLLVAGAGVQVDRSILLFRVLLLLVWAGAVALGAAILLWRPALMVPQHYDLATVRLAAGLWAAVWLAIVVQVPLNVLLQAGGEFRTLANASIGAGAVSVMGVLAAILLARPVWTVAAILPGWLLSTAVIVPRARAVRRALAAA